ncbi:phage terminase small subunit [Marinobacter oulmenensis]|uniref:Tetratricopeptide (TPR) repeat protein n=1 Tax=Marinobacter oulmenensis TaxID=643747 RepID=A0A840U5R9_9GAMM|nr:phage terminase small subunit [Marinobacter oulmenensis]MBB5320479.1 tetratricopeptide (TPR) repeat protein [Marinobacter oulmenensis]
MVSPAKKAFEKKRVARVAAQEQAEKQARLEAEKRQKELEERRQKHQISQPPSAQESGPVSAPANSPAKKVRTQQQAKKEAQGATDSQPHGSAYDLHYASMMEDMRALHDIESVQGKIERKRELLPKYEDYVAGVMEGGTGHQDDVIMNIMVWYLDTGQLEKGLDIAEYAAKHGLETPDRYQRSTAALVSEEVADFVLKERGEGEEPAEYLAQVSRALINFGESDMHDQIKAKLYKAHGYLLREAEQPERAVESLKKALELDERAGVKMDIQALEKQLKNSGQ